MQNLPINLQTAAKILSGDLVHRQLKVDPITRGRIIERELPALQKAVQTQKDFTARVPKYEPINPKKDVYPWNDYTKELMDLEEQHKKHEPDPILDPIFSSPVND